ncbi:MAG: hypothetical protein AB1898_23105 [Acidobacteriota bacterium]
MGLPEKSTAESGEESPVAERAVSLFRSERIEDLVAILAAALLVLLVLAGLRV